MVALSGVCITCGGVSGGVIEVSVIRVVVVATGACVARGGKTIV